MFVCTYNVPVIALFDWSACFWSDTARCVLACCGGCNILSSGQCLLCVRRVEHGYACSILNATKCYDLFGMYVYRNPSWTVCQVMPRCKLTPEQGKVSFFAHTSLLPCHVE